MIVVPDVQELIDGFKKWAKEDSQGIAAWSALCSALNVEGCDASYSGSTLHLLGNLEWKDVLGGWISGAGFHYPSGTVIYSNSRAAMCLYLQRLYTETQYNEE